MILQKKVLWMAVVLALTITAYTFKPKQEKVPVIPVKDFFRNPEKFS